MKTIQIILILISGLVAGLLPECVCAQDGVQVMVRSYEASVTQPLVRIRDVAELSGGDQANRNRIGELDLELIDAGSDPVSITQRQIEFRILVEGVPESGFDLSGAAQVSIRLTAVNHFQDHVENFIRQQIGAQFGIPADDIRVQLIDGDQIEQIRDAFQHLALPTLAVFQNGLPVGENTVEVEFADQLNQRKTFRLKTQIVVVQEVLVSRNAIPRGTVITAEYLYPVRRPLPDNTIDPAGIAMCIGCVAARDIPRHEIITTAFLAPAPSAEAIGIRTGDFVDALVISGAVTIRLKNAKALSSGVVGETIEVLNTDSNKRLIATVHDKSTVIVNQ